MDGPTTPRPSPSRSRRRRRRRSHGGLVMVVGAAVAASFASRGGVEAAAAAFLAPPVPAMPAAAVARTASSATTPGMSKRAACGDSGDRRGGQRRRPTPAAPAAPPPLSALLPALGRLALAIPALGGLLGATSFPGLSTAAAATTSATRAVVTLDTLGSSNTGAAAQGNGGIDYACLLGRCGKELGQVLLDPRGMHELACLVTCGPSDLACQMRCGDMYQEDVLQRFHACAISKHQCVPQHVEATATQVPDPSLLVPSLDLSALKGEWYIAYGLNPTMDCFPCQHHTAIVEEDKGQQPTTISSDSSKKPPPLPAITFDVTYRVPHSGTLRTFDRRLQQRFEQDPQHPGLIHARDFGYLKQEDDWYILAADPSSYMVVWYRGCNRAWCGYTGGVVYSRTPQLAPEVLPAVKEAAAKAGVSFERMCPTDNSCALQQQQQPPLRRQEATTARATR